MGPRCAALHVEDYIKRETIPSHIWSLMLLLILSLNERISLGPGKPQGVWELTPGLRIGFLGYYSWLNGFNR